MVSAIFLLLPVLFQCILAFETRIPQPADARTVNHSTVSKRTVAAQIPSGANPITVPSSSKNTRKPDFILPSIIKFMQRNYSALQPMFNNLPRGIKLTVDDANVVLRIDGYELQSKDWEHQLCFLELVYDTNFLTQVYIDRLQFNRLISSYLYRLLLKNSQSIRVLHVTNYVLERDCVFDWDLSTFSNLVDFKVSGSNWFLDDSVVLNSVPVSLKGLDIAVKAIVSSKFLDSLFEKLENLEFLKLEAVDLLDQHCPATIFAMRKLRFVHFINSNVGIKVWEEMSKYSLNWVHFTLASKRIPDFSLSNLGPMRELIQLNLSNTGISLPKFVENLPDYLSLLPSLKSVYLFGDSVQISLMVPASIVERGIKLYFDHERVWFVQEEWENYCRISTGVHINFQFDSNMLMELFGKLTRNPSLIQHMTHLTIECLSTTEELETLVLLLRYLPNLKFLSIEIFNSSYALLNELQAFRVTTSVEVLIIRLASVYCATDILISLLNQFPHVEKIEVHHDGWLNGTKLATLLPFERLNEMVLDADIAFKHCGAIFHWISTLPRLEALEIRFSQNAGIIVRQYGSLRNLPILRLKRLQISSKLPYSISKEMAALYSKLPNLTHLDIQLLHHDEIVDLVSNFHKIPALRHLELRHYMNINESNHLANGICRLQLLQKLVCHHMRRLEQNFYLLNRFARKLPYFHDFKVQYAKPYDERRFMQDLRDIHQRLLIAHPE